MSTEIVGTAFDSVQRELGCEFMDWEGWRWPNHFGDPVAEHRAVRENAGVWDESPLRKWDFRGPDALRAADRIFTNDMAGLEIGQIRYAPFCDEDGKMVGDGTVFKFDDEHAWAITALDSDLEHFEQVVDGLDVEIEPITPALPHVQLQGPRSRDLLASLCDADVPALRYFRFFPEQVRVGGVPVWVSRTGYSGELGYEIFCGPDDATELWERAHGRGRCPVRAGRGRDAADRVRADLHRLRLLPARDGSLRRFTRQGRPSRHRRLPREAGPRRNRKEPPPRRMVTLASTAPRFPSTGRRSRAPASRPAR